jgi:hypothetical protein
VSQERDRADYRVTEIDEAIHIATDTIEASIRKTGYVSGVAGGSFKDLKSGFHDAGFGLDIVDWIMEPGSDEAYRGELDHELIYQFNNSYHGKTPKRSIEGPQICTQAKEVRPEVIRGDDFVAVRTSFTYKTAAPGKKAGSRWTQTLVFPQGKRYFVACDRIDAVNDSDAMFLRIDMPGHIKHEKGDTFTEVYLSYFENSSNLAVVEGRIASDQFLENFAPDERFNYRRDRVSSIPERMIRGYRLRDPQSGQEGPWLVGMTLDPSMVYEAWCHQRGYVCMIEEIGGYPVRAGESFGAAYVVGYFDSIEQMEAIYDKYKGARTISVSADGWELVGTVSADNGYEWDNPVTRR